MKIFFVDYDLRNVRDYNDYKALTEKLEELGGVRVLKSLWSLKMPDYYTSDDICQLLLKEIDEDDAIIVSQVINCAYTRNVINEPD